MTKKETPELVRVAEEIERDLSRLEELSHSTGHIRLHNDKSISLAGRKLQEGLEQQEQLALGLRALAGAMSNMQQRQQAAIERLAKRALDIQAQVMRLSDHMERFGALGTKASEATRILESLPPPYGTGEAPAVPIAGPPEQLMQVDVLLAAVATEAKQLATSAETVDLSDVQKEATALRQRVDSARTQLALLSQTRPPQSN